MTTTEAFNKFNAVLQNSIDQFPEESPYIMPRMQVNTFLKIAEKNKYLINIRTKFGTNIVGKPITRNELVIIKKANLISYIKKDEIEFITRIK